MEVTVKEKFNRTAPRKLRLVANLIRGWQTQKALNQLRFIPKAAAQDLTKTLQSALGAAKESNLDLDKTFIKSLMINEGPSIKRRVMMSRGRATQVKKRMSHIIMTVAEQELTKPEKSVEKQDSIKEIKSVKETEQVKEK